MKNLKALGLLLAVSTMMVTTSVNVMAAYPENDIEVIVPKGAGGGTDTSTRGLLTYMEKNLDGASFNVTK